MPKKISRTQYDLLGALVHGGTLRGTRLYPGPWHYKTNSGVEYSDTSIIDLVQKGALASSMSGDEIHFSVTEIGRTFEREFAVKRQGKRERGG